MESESSSIAGARRRRRHRKVSQRPKRGTSKTLRARRWIVIITVVAGLIYMGGVMLQMAALRGRYGDFSLGAGVTDVRRQNGRPSQIDAARRQWRYVSGDSVITLTFDADQRLSGVECVGVMVKADACPDVGHISLGSDEVEVRRLLGWPQAAQHGEDRLLVYPAYGLTFTMARGQVQSISLASPVGLGAYLRGLFWKALP